MICFGLLVVLPAVQLAVRLFEPVQLVVPAAGPVATVELLAGFADLVVHLVRLVTQHFAVVAVLAAIVVELVAFVADQRLIVLAVRPVGLVELAELLVVLVENFVVPLK